MVQTSPDLLHLAHGPHALILAPGIGGSIVRYFSQRGDASFEWLRPASAAALAQGNPLGMASFPLLPFCNRIREGRAPARARTIQMRANMPDSPHTLHGVGWRLPWQVAAQTSNTATLTLDHARDDWPFDFRATQFFELDDALHITMTLENRDSVAMPAGLGHHPYFLRDARTWLRSDVSGMWQSDAELMPTHLSSPPLLAQLRQGCLIDELNLDNNFTGWQRQSEVRWPQHGAALTMTAHAPFDFFVLYVPPALDHFCMEPVSNCTDWLNLQRVQPDTLGGHWLEPGEVLQAQFTLAPRFIERQP
ncbi:aldose 1-epimerase [Silvimonas sp. JCM 19000]